MVLRSRERNNPFPDIVKLTLACQTEETAIFWYNGKPIQANTLELPIDDPGLLYGATVFTTLRVYHQSLDSALTNWVGHCDRLLTSIQTFGWQQPDWNRIRQGAEILMARFPVLRITVFPDGREWITGRFLPDNLTETQYRGIAVIAVAGGQFQRCLPADKTGNYLSPWLAKSTAKQMAADEAILVDENGNWLETCTGNLWGWQNSSWWTPPLAAGILPGIMRSQLISWLKSHNYPVKQEPWSPELVKDFEAIAYTNSVVEVVPIHTVIESQLGANRHSPAQSQVETGKTNKLSYDPYHPSFKLLRRLFAKESDENYAQD